jgi:hypothetical protein
MPLPWVKIWKDFGNLATLFITMYSSCIKATSVLFWNICQVKCSSPGMLV